METNMSEQALPEQPVETQQFQKTAPSTKEVIAYLAGKFPHCFILDGEVKPLKIGLFQDLAVALEGDEFVSKTSLRHALRAYTMSWRYLSACQIGAVRVGIQGEEAGEVDVQQAEHAAQTLAEAKAAFAERKAQQRKEQRKAFFKQKAREENAKKRSERKAAEPAKASTQSLEALANKFAHAKAR